MNGRSCYFFIGLHLTISSSSRSSNAHFPDITLYLHSLPRTSLDFPTLFYSTYMFMGTLCSDCTTFTTILCRRLQEKEVDISWRVEGQKKKIEDLRAFAARNVSVMALRRRQMYHQLLLLHVLLGVTAGDRNRNLWVPELSEFKAILEFGAFTRKSHYGLQALCTELVLSEESCGQTMLHRYFWRATVSE